MKKLLSFLLAFVAGFVGLSAQQYEMVGDYLTEVPENGVEVALKSIHYNKGWLCQDEYSQNLTKECVFTFEATGKTCDGEPTYLLYNVSLGKYLQHEQYDTDEDTSATIPGTGGHMIRYTSDKSLAYEFTCLPSAPKTADNENARTWANEGGWAEGSFVLAGVKIQDCGGGTVGYLGAYDLPFMSIYTDTNQWYITRVRVMAKSDALVQELQQLLPAGPDIYETGTQPGQVDAALLAELKKAYDEAMQLVNPTDDQCDQALEKVRQAKEALDASVVMPQAGKYYVMMGRRGAADALYDAGGQLKAVQNYEMPALEDENIEEKLGKIWLYEDAGDGAFYMKNFETSRYICNAVKNQSYQITCSTENPAAFKTLLHSTETIHGCFNIQNVADDRSKLHVAGGYQIVYWNDANAPGDLFCIREVDRKIIDAFAAQLAQRELQQRLESVIHNATYTLSKARRYSSAALTDEPSMETGEELLEPGNGEANFASNALADNEGENCSLSALTDNNYDTYFHSKWSGAPTEGTYHWLDVNFDEAVSGALQMKYVERKGQHANCSPVRFSVYGKNGDDDFKYLFDINLTYTIPVLFTEPAEGEEPRPVENAAGITGFQLPQAYESLRFECKQTMKNQLLSGVPFWYLSELNFYKAQYDEQSSPIKSVPAGVVKALDDALSAASAAVAAGNATEANVQALSQAYEAFMAAFPDPEALTAALQQAKEQINAMEAGEALGYFDAEAKAAALAAIDGVQVADVMSLEQINAGKKVAEDAVAAVQASLHMPQQGKVYILRQGRGGNENAQSAGALYAASTGASGSAEAPLRYMFREQVDGDETDSEGNPVKVWADPYDVNQRLAHFFVADEVKDGKIALRSLSTGRYIAPVATINANVGLSRQKQLLPLIYSGVAGKFRLVVGETQEDGQLALNFAGGRVQICGWSIDDAGNNFSMEEVSQNDVDEFWANQSNLFWPVADKPATFCTLPVNAQLSDDNFKAYTVLGGLEADGKQTLELSAVGDNELPAGTPFVLVRAEGAEATMAEFWLNEQECAAKQLQYAEQAKAQNGLQGCLEQVSIGVNTSFGVMDGMKLKTDQNGKDATLIAANTGYIDLTKTIPAAPAAGDLSIELSGRATLDAILSATVEASRAQRAAYDLSGRRVSAAQKGVFIIDGKKVVR